MTLASDANIDGSSHHSHGAHNGEHPLRAPLASSSSSVDAAVSPQLRESLDSWSTMRLSRLSCNTKCAITLNQIDHVEINSCYEREHDGVIMYVLDVYLKYYQTGIPSVGRSTEFFHELFSHKSASNCDAVSVPSTQAARSPEKTTKKPQHQIEYRYSAVRAFRKRLRNAVEDTDEWQHLKWCCYCSKMQWLTVFGPFPSRHPLSSMAANVVHWQQHLCRFVHRQQKLASFINRVLATAKDSSYRYQSSQCHCYANVSSIVTEFLAAVDPQPRTTVMLE